MKLMGGYSGNVAYLDEMFDGVLEEDEVHAVTAHHLVVLRQEHVEPVLQVVERLDGLVDFGQLHVHFLRFVASGLGGVAHEINEVVVLQYVLGELVPQVTSHVIDQLLLEPVLVRLRRESET